MSALVQPTASKSSMETSTTTTHTSIFSLNPHITHLASNSKEERRASLSLIDSTRVRLTKDFRALVRSNSSSGPKGDARRLRSRAQTPPERGARTRIVAFSAYAPIAPEEPARELRMSRDESRSGRGFGARLVGFLNRSRSRSRSKKRRSQSLDDVPVSEMPISLPGGSLGRRNAYVDTALGPDSSSSSSSASGTKPATRSPSRPLSGATTVTDTTVKPYQRRTPQPVVAKPVAAAAEHRVHLRTEVLATDPSTSLQTTKKANIFSVAISHPRKQPSGESSKSRPPSRAHTSTPPTPSAERVHRGLWSTFRSASRSGSQSSVGGQSTRSTAGENGAARSTPPPVPKLRQDSNGKRPRITIPPADELGVHVLNSPPPPYRRDDYAQDAEAEPDTLDLGGRCSPLCGLPSPKLTATVAPSTKGKEKERARGSRDRTRASIEDKGRRVEDVTRPMRVGSPIPREIEREKRTLFTPLPIEKVASGSGSGLSRRSSAKESVTGAIRAKRTKHGSFDFERPVSTNVGRVPSMRTALHRMGVGPDLLSRSSAQPMERTTSAKELPARPGESRIQAQKQSSSLPSSVGRPAKRPTLDVHAAPMARRPTDSSRETTSPLPPHHPSTPRHPEHDPNTPNSSHSGHSSSLGRSAGGRMLRTLHGPFKFEPAVPPIPGSPAGEERPGRHSDVAASPSKLRQERVTAHGRSLDLGLTLSWAPQKVREDAVLSYNRPNSRLAGGSVKPPSRWRNDVAGEGNRLEAGSSRATSDVARAFKEALGDAAYATFKTYVHRFDAQAIPLDGPYGLISHASRLLDNAASLDERRKQDLLNRFVRLVRENQ